jgi:hypothetical protein
MVSQIDSGLAFLPAWLAELVGDVALEVALDILIDITTPSTGAYIYEELHGLAAGAGLEYKKLARTHLIGELTQGDCSLIGAWGGATAGGKTLQLRALDCASGAAAGDAGGKEGACKRAQEFSHPPHPLP